MSAPSAATAPGLFADARTALEFFDLAVRFKKIKGWVHAADGYLLYRLARDDAADGERGGDRGRDGPAARVRRLEETRHLHRRRGEGAGHVGAEMAALQQEPVERAREAIVAPAVGDELPGGRRLRLLRVTREALVDPVVLRARRRLGVALVHVQPGMANALSRVLNAARARVPLLVALPLVALAIWTGQMVRAGYEGKPARDAGKAYWRRNSQTWENAPSPALDRVDAVVHLGDYIYEDAGMRPGAVLLMECRASVTEKFSPEKTRLG